MSFAALRSPTWRTAPPWREPVEGGYQRPDPALWTPQLLPGLRALYDAELGQPHYSPDPYVQLDGTSGDYIFTPDSANLDIAGDVEVVMRVKCNDWTAAATQTLCGKYVSSGNQRSWRFYVNSAGNVGLSASPDGTAVTTATVTPTTPLPDATWIWLRLRLDLSNGANSVGTVDTAADQAEEPTSWTANGSATSTIIASVFNSTAPLEIGTFANGTLERFSGQIARCIVRDGFDGPVVADFNASDCYGDGYWHTGGYRWNLGLPKIYDRSGNNVAPATFGSGSNQPQWLPWTGRSKVHLPGTVSNFVSCPDAAALDVTSLEWVARLSATDWTPSAIATLIAHDDAVANSWRIDLLTTGALRFTKRSVADYTSTSVLPFLDGMTYWVRVTYSSSTGDIKFYYAADAASEPSVWTQLGTTVSSPATSLAATTVPLCLGISPLNVQPFNGVIERSILRNADTAGATVADFNAELCGQSGYTDAYLNPWSVNRSTTGSKTVVQSPAAWSARSVIRHASDDWIDVPAAAVPALDTFAAASSVTASFRRWHNPGASNHAIFTTKASAGNTVLGMALRLFATAASPLLGVQCGDGSANDGYESAGNLTVPLGARGVASVSVGDSNPFITAVVNDGSAGSDIARGTTVTTSTGGAGRIGAYTGGTAPIDMEFESLICRDVATTSTEHGLQVAYYGGGL